MAQTASPLPVGLNPALLYLVPFLAVGALGVALSLIPLSLWRRVPLIVPYLAASLLGVLAVLAAVPLVVAYTSLQSAQAQIEAELGVFAGLAGEALTLESGFWVTAAGLGLVALGALIAVGAIIAGLLLPRGKASAGPSSQT
jgi:hypothetical protein